MAYNREKAVAYAMEWWNDYNPSFPVFSVDCTNFVSQCLLAGGLEMWGKPDKGVGWWADKDNWSFSWSVAHSLYWYLRSNPGKVNAIMVGNPRELDVGDVICYDFQGDSRWDHTTIVVDQDQTGLPLVNAHTVNCLRRNWEYRDSLAYTGNIQYAFFHIES